MKKTNIQKSQDTVPLSGRYLIKYNTLLLPSAYLSLAFDLLNSVSGVFLSGEIYVSRHLPFFCLSLESLPTTANYGT